MAKSPPKARGSQERSSAKSAKSAASRAPAGGSFSSARQAAADSPPRPSGTLPRKLYKIGEGKAAASSGLVLCVVPNRYPARVSFLDSASARVILPGWE